MPASLHPAVTDDGPMESAFTRLVGCTVPLQQAGMGGTATPALAVAVADAGALGMLAMPTARAAAVADALDSVRGHTAGAAGAVGINFLAPFVDREASPPPRPTGRGWSRSSTASQPFAGDAHPRRGSVGPLAGGLGRRGPPARSSASSPPTSDDKAGSEVSRRRAWGSRRSPPTRRPASPGLRPAAGAIGASAGGSTPGSGPSGWRTTPTLATAGPTPPRTGW